MTTQAPRRVVITGLGAVSPLGNTASELWEAMKAGRSGIQKIDKYKNFPTTVFAPVKTDSWSFVEELPPAVKTRMTRPMHMLFAAVREALDQSKLREQTGAMRIGIIAGTTANYHCEMVGSDVEAEPVELLRYFTAATPDGSDIDWTKFLQKNAYPANNTLRHLANMLTCVPALHFGLRGTNETIHNACATGTQAVGAAFRLIKHGHAEAILAGGADTMLDWVGVSVLGRLGVLSTHDDPSNACRPFDAKRNGMVLGEGAAILAVESLESAQRRGATILAEIVGHGSTANAYRITDSPIEGISAGTAIGNAIKEAKIDPSEIDAISAHGTSTSQNDAAETNALKRALGDAATKIPTMAPKSMLGHSLSAAGAIELVAAVRVLQTGFLTGAPSYQNPDPDCDLAIVNEGKQVDKVRYLLKNSFGFGGQNGALVLKNAGDLR